MKTRGLLWLAIGITVLVDYGLLAAGRGYYTPTGSGIGLPPRPASGWK